MQVCVCVCVRSLALVHTRCVDGVFIVPQDASMQSRLVTLSSHLSCVYILISYSSVWLGNKASAASGVFSVHHFLPSVASVSDHILVQWTWSEHTNERRLAVGFGNCPYYNNGLHSTTASLWLYSQFMVSWTVSAQASVLAKPLCTIGGCHVVKLLKWRLIYTILWIPWFSI